VRSIRAAFNNVTAGWMTGLPFCSAVWKTLDASSACGHTVRRTSSSRGVADRGAAAANRPRSKWWKTRISAGPVARTANGSVLVSPTRIDSSYRSRPAARLNARLPRHDPGQTTTLIPARRWGPASVPSEDVAYAGPTARTTSASLIASAMSVVASLISANPLSTPVLVMPPRSWIGGICSE
jgi:hypothetical protein